MGDVVKILNGLPKGLREKVVSRMLAGPKTGSLIKDRQKLSEEEAEQVLLALLVIREVNPLAELSKEEKAHLKGISTRIVKRD